MKIFVNLKFEMFLMAVIIFIGHSVTLSAKSLKVATFSPSPFDLSASTNQKLDNNGIPCALIKIPISDRIKNVSFEGNIIEQINDGSEILAYITAGTKQIIIKSEGFPPLRLVFSDFGVYRLFSKQVYNLSLQISATSDTSTASSSHELTSIHDLLENSQGDNFDEIVAEANKLYAECKPEDALPLLKKAAGLGHPEALLSLGLLYEKGIGINDNWLLEPDEFLAFKNVQNAAHQGYAPAQKVLSRYYFTGMGVDENNDLGDLWKRNYDNNVGNLDDKIFTSVEIPPEYPGGEKQLLKDVYNGLIYPSSAQENGTQGHVKVRFVVKKMAL